MVVEDDAFIRKRGDDDSRLGSSDSSASDVDEAQSQLRMPQRIDALFTDIYLKSAVLGGCELAQQAIKLRPDLRALHDRQFRHRQDESTVRGRQRTACKTIHRTPVAGIRRASARRRELRQQNET
jgi:hypothetical protein